MQRLIAFLFERLFRKVRLAWCSSIEAAAVPGIGGIAFVGDSITHNGRWDLIFPHAATRNFGINGDRTDQVLSRLDPVIRIDPSKIFVLIGTNDLGQGVDMETIVANLEQMLEKLGTALPDCTIYLQTVMPRAAKFAARIRALNARYAQIAERRGLVLVDLYPAFDDGGGKMRSEFTYDDLHLNGAGYTHWRDVLAPHVPDRR
ncbi:GDSL-type esterase/lipase family protein [Solimonas terrae]|uniref:SGNH hydrolase-type esterase domain-containing protein n=1 Tax=Solimonas terrae TaxID=1396819 RepID=A0A6M2BTL8_9GAMM|nr:GDSL-type esterase/lipase family protein [Solimonas terrae]NGY05575.1 hypothetical protein [Solimonas terrae]